MLTLSDKMSARGTNRWHTTFGLQSQDLASHSAMVAIIVEYLYKSLTPDISTEEELYILKYCLIHDMEEIITGDSPGNFKAALRKVQPEFMEKWDLICDKINPEAAAYKKKLKGSPYLIMLKIADYMDALSFNASSIHPMQERIHETLIGYINKLVKKGQKEFSSIPWEKSLGVLDDLLAEPEATLALEDLLK